MQVDHIIPEELLRKPAAFAKVRETYGLADDFQINSYENWMPACGPCNNDKRAAVFEPVMIVLRQLQKAKEKAAFAAASEKQTVSDRVLSKALLNIERAAVVEDIDQNLLKALIAAFETARAKRERVEGLAGGKLVTKAYTTKPAVAKKPSAKPAPKAFAKPAAKKAALAKKAASAPDGYANRTPKSGSHIAFATKLHVPVFANTGPDPSVATHRMIRIAPFLRLRFKRDGWE